MIRITRQVELDVANINDEAGNPRMFYHGTTHQFDSFSLQSTDCGIHFGTKEQAESRLLLREDETSSFQLIGVYLKVCNPLILHDDPFTGVPFTFFRKLCSDELYSENGVPVLTESEERLLIQKWGKDFEDGDYAYTTNDYQFYRDTEALIQAKGYDSICYFNDVESDGDSFSYSWCVFDPSQIQIISREEG